MTLRKLIDSVVFDHRHDKDAPNAIVSIDEAAAPIPVPVYARVDGAAPSVLVRRFLVSVRPGTASDKTIAMQCSLSIDVVRASLRALAARRRVFKVGDEWKAYCS
jgi:hypothetical protein